MVRKLALEQQPIRRRGGGRGGKICSFTIRHGGICIRANVSFTGGGGGLNSQLDVREKHSHYNTNYLRNYLPMKEKRHRGTICQIGSFLRPIHGSKKKLCEVRWLAVHFAQGTAATTGTNVRTLPCSVPCPAESHETVDKPICITPAEKDKRARSDIRREKSRVDKVGYRLSPAYREKAKSRREKPS